MQLEFTLARPWKLNVRTNSPFLVSLWRTRKEPWPAVPPASTRWAASMREKVEMSSIHAGEGAVKPREFPQVEFNIL